MWISGYKSTSLLMTPIIKKMEMERIKQMMAAVTLAGIENSFLILSTIVFMGNLFGAKF